MTEIREVRIEYKKVRKDALFMKFAHAFDEYVNGIVLVVNVNCAGSFQLQKLRAALRDKGVLIMGKNTLIRKVLRERAAYSPAYNDLFPFLTGTIGLLFTHEDVVSVEKLIRKHTYTSLPPRVGVPAHMDIVTPCGLIGLDPSRTSYFGALNIPTKISKGQIEILQSVVICKKGEIVNNTVFCFCQALNMKPFFREAVVEAVYDRGYVFSRNQYILPSLREINFMRMFLNSVFRFAAISAALGIVNEATMPYYFAGALGTVRAVARAIGYRITEPQHGFTISYPLMGTESKSNKI